MQIDIDERERKAMQLFKEGYNCAQSVALAFSDIIGQEQGLSEEQIGAAMTGFGGGFGRLREVCGTVSGMTFVAGCVCPAPAITGGHGVQEKEKEKEKEQEKKLEGETPQKQKARNYELVQELAGRFKEENGSIICRELLELRAKAVAAGREQSVDATRQLVEAKQLAAMHSTAPTPSERTAEYYKARPCEQLVGIAARILATKLAETGN